MNIINEINNNLNERKTFILATIVNVTGSSPRKVGAKMIVFPDGSISNTVGGGYFEKMVIDDCLKLFASGEKHLYNKYNFSQFGENPTGMCCGGTAELFLELYNPPAKLLIFGGGHVGLELANLSSNAGFIPIIVDDREEILKKINSNIETIQTDADYKDNFPAIDKNCFIVIVTRSHKTDKAVLEQTIKKDSKYLGMIGSKSKIKKLYAQLEKDGIEQKLFEKVNAPIGLDIKAEGPYEIAVSILAEIIAVKNK